MDSLFNPLTPMASSPDFRAWRFVNEFTALQAAHLIYGFDVENPYWGSERKVQPIVTRMILDHGRAVDSLRQKFRSVEGKTTRIDSDDHLEPGCLPSIWLRKMLNDPIQDYDRFVGECDMQATLMQDHTRDDLAAWLQENKLQSVYDFATGETTGLPPPHQPIDPAVAAAARKAKLQAEYRTLSGDKRGKFLEDLVHEFGTQTKVAELLDLTSQTVSKHLSAWKHQPERTHRNYIFGGKRPIG